MTSKKTWQAEPCPSIVLPSVFSRVPLSAMKKHIPTLKRTPFLFFLFTVTVAAFCAATTATTGIKGKVTDEKGQPIVSASITVIDSKGNPTGRGAASDIDGNYVLPLQPGTYHLKASYIGYQPKASTNIVVTAGKTTTADFQLAVSPMQINPVVVNGHKLEKKLSEQSVSMEVVRSENIVNYDRSNYGYASGKSYAASPATGAAYYAAPVTYNWTAVDKKASTKYKRADDAQYSINGRKITKTEEYNIDMMPMPYPVDDAERDTMTAATFKEIKDNLFISPAAMPLSTFSIDVDVASYGMTRKKINDGMLPPADAVRIEEMVNYFPYSYADPKDDKPFAVHTEFAECPWDASHRLLRIGIQGKRAKEETLPPSNLVFLVDVSGSMMSPERLPLIQKSLGMLVDKMRPQDHIALVTYAGNAGLVLPSTSGADKDKIKQAINNLTAGGSTAGGAGIELAYKVAVDNFIKEGNNRVMLCTDGDFNVGISGEAPLTAFIEQKRKTGVFLSVLGVGTDNYKDREMEALADKGNGNYAYIDNEKEAKKNLVTQMGGTLHVIAKDVKIQAVFNPSCVKSYRLIGYEDRKLENRDFSNDKIDAGEIGAGTAVTAIYEVVLGPNRKESTVALEDKKGKDEMTLAADDLMALRIRYKAPTGDKSQLIESHVSVTSTDLASTSEDFRFAAAVTGFGMLLRNSPFKGDFTYDKAKALAKGSLGADPENYRHEFVSMIDQAHNIATKTASK